MASLDNLPADQKAVLSLVLQRGRTFDQIAQLLSIDRAAVRQRALEGFDALGPDTTLEPLKRALITDYLLGQLPAAVAATVASSLASSPTERAWARVIAAEIAPLAVNGLPEIPSAAAAAAPAPAPVETEPEPEPAPAGVADPVAQESAAPAARRGAPARQPAAASTAASRAPAGGRGSAAGPRSSRRGGAILLGLIVLVVVVVVVVLLVTNSSSNSTSKRAQAAVTHTTTTGGVSTAAAGTSTAVTTLHQMSLTPPTAVKGREGAAAVVRANGELGLVLAAEGLPANTSNAYAVWLYDSKTQASDFLGFYSKKVAASGKTKGDLEAEVKLPASVTGFNELLLTVETAEKPTKPGTVVLQGSFAE